MSVKKIILVEGTASEIEERAESIQSKYDFHSVTPMTGMKPKSECSMGFENTYMAIFKLTTTPPIPQ